MASRLLHRDHRRNRATLDLLSRMPRQGRASASHRGSGQETHATAESILMEQETIKCPSCSRERASGWEAVGKSVFEFCVTQNDATCVLTQQKNSLIAATRLLAKQKCDEVTVRTVMAIVEQIEPSGHRCPSCGSPGQVIKGTVKVHFSLPGDAKPCPASYLTVIGGLLFNVPGKK